MGEGVISVYSVISVYRQTDRMTERLK